MILVTGWETPLPPNSGGRMPTRDYFANAAGSALTRSAIALRRLLYNYRQRECGDGRCICLPHAVINQFQLGRVWHGRIAQCKAAGRAGQIFIGRKLRLSQRLQRTCQRFYPLPGVARAGVSLQLHQQRVACVQLNGAVGVGCGHDYAVRFVGRAASRQSGSSQQAGGCQPNTAAAGAHCKSIT